MKVTKMSLVAAMLLGTGLFAIENTKIDGNAQTFYQTKDAKDIELFSKDGSSADVGLHLNATSDLVKADTVAISAGAGLTTLTTLGLENNLVSAPWAGSHMATLGNGSSFGNKVDNVYWMNEAWMAATAGKTTAKLGRMALDTPLAFTETWTIEQNTFEAGVLMNEDIPDTTLIGAYIGNGNGTETFGQNLQNNHGLSTGGIVNGGGEFGTYGTNGAYAVGAINNSVEPLTLQAWYYDLTHLADTYWLQADLSIEGFMLGAQYNAMQAAAGGKEDNVYAVMAGYEMADTFLAKIAYSEVNEGGELGGAGFNTATDQAFAQSKLYTEAWWNYGQITMSGAKAVNVTVTSPLNGIVDAGLYITSIDQVAADADLLEVTASVSKSFGPLDTSLVYIYADAEAPDSDSSLVQLYLTLNF